MHLKSTMGWTHCSGPFPNSFPNWDSRLCCSSLDVGFAQVGYIYTIYTLHIYIYIHTHTHTHYDMIYTLYMYIYRYICKIYMVIYTLYMTSLICFYFFSFNDYMLKLS